MNRRPRAEPAAPARPVLTPLSRRAVLAGAAGLGLHAALAGSPAAALARQTGAETAWPTGGWQSAAPADLGIDPAALDEVAARVPSETPDLSALVVVRRGELAWERSFNGYDPAAPINVRSVTKSVTGTLVGAALEEGALRDLDQTVGELIPDRIPAGADPRVAGVTLRQLLTMTSGLDWSAATDWPTLIASPDWVRLTLGLPVTGVPGETFVYNTGGSHVLGVMVAAATQTPLDAYARTKLFDPLGMKPGSWMRSPQGEPNGGSGLELTPRDMAKLGLLYLRGGTWASDRVAPADYVQAATVWQSAGDATGGWAAYGYQWWVTATDQGYPAAFALGYGGQHVFIVPDLGLVVVAAIQRRVAPEELRTPRFLIERIVAGTAP